MKIFSIPAFGACVFLIFFLASAGCTGIAEQGTDPNCTRPYLIFNDSQEVTQIYDISYTSPFEPARDSPGRVPLGGVVYRSSGFTRIFDATGKQILRVNDAESVNPTPAGYQTAACVQSVLPGMRYVPEGENIRNVYVAGHDACIASIITRDGSCLQANTPKF